MKLADIVKMKAGHPFRGSIPEVLNTGVRAVQMKDVSLGGGIDWATTIETEVTGKREPDWLLPGDILFAIRGNHNYAVLVDDHNAKGRAVASPHFFILRRKSEVVLLEFLVWQLNQGPLQRYFQRESAGSLTKSLRREALESAPVVIPSMEKQLGIVNLANSVMQGHRLLEKLIRNNETMMDCIATDLLKGTLK